MAFVAYSRNNQFGKVADGDFFTCTYIDVAVTNVFIVWFIGVFEVYMFHDEYTGICHFFAPKEFAKRCTGTPKFHFIVTDTVFSKNGENILFAAGSVNAFYGTEIQVFVYGIPITLFQTVGKVYLANHGRKYMTAFQIEIIVRAIEVGRHYSNIICTVLQVETFAHFQSGNLSYGIGFIGIFQGRGKKYFFFHGLLGIAWINASAAQEEEFLYIMAETFADDVLLYLQVLVDEISTIDTVCHDAAYESGSKEYIFRLFFIKESTNGNGVQ